MKIGPLEKRPITLFDLIASSEDSDEEQKGSSVGGAEQAEDRKEAAQIGEAEEEHKELKNPVFSVLSKDELSRKRQESFFRRNFRRFCDPPRWVMVERTCQTHLFLKSNKLFYEDYSSSSDDEDCWQREIDNCLSPDEQIQNEW